LRGQDIVCQACGEPKAFGEFLASLRPHPGSVEVARRMRELLAGGVTTVEIKSGYGLETATELRQLA